MGKHDPDRVHWAKVLKIIREAGNTGIAIYAIGKGLELEKNSSYLDDTIKQLLRHGKIRVMMGLNDESMPCRIAQIKDDGPSKRQMIVNMA